MLDEPGGVAAVIKAGGKVDRTDHRHMTALMLAIATDRANPGNVQQLIDSGADVNVKDRYGETALDWAQKYRNPEILAALERAGAKGKGLPPAPVKPTDYKPDAREAITRASALLANSPKRFSPPAGDAWDAITSRSRDALSAPSRRRVYRPNRDCGRF